MLVLSETDQKQLFSMHEAIEAVGVALGEYSAGRAITPIRTVVPVEKRNGSAVFMPSLAGETPPVAGCIEGG